MSLETTVPSASEVKASTEPVLPTEQVKEAPLSQELPKPATPKVSLSSPKKGARTTKVEAKNVGEGKIAGRAPKKSPVQAEKQGTQKVEAAVVAPPEAEKVAKGKKSTAKKPKLIRDSFTIPENDYALFATLKQRSIAGGVEVKKGELLRAALGALSKMKDADFLNEVRSVERIKAGRPKK